MSKCKVCATTDKIVYSGVDALLLGIDGAETGTYCYPCANKANKDRQDDDDNVINTEEPTA